MSFDRQQVVPLPNHQSHSHHFAFYDSFGTTKHEHLDHERSDIVSHLRQEFYSDGTAGAKSRFPDTDCQESVTETASNSTSRDTSTSVWTRDATVPSSTKLPSSWATLNNFARGVRLIIWTMDEILLLQQQLMAVQNSSTLYKLANRNVMEIIDMLTKKFGLVLYFTSDGEFSVLILRSGVYRA